MHAHTHMHLVGSVSLETLTDKGVEIIREICGYKKIPQEIHPDLEVHPSTLTAQGRNEPVSMNWEGRSDRPSWEGGLD